MILDFLKRLDELGDAGADIREAIEKLGGLNGEVHDSSVNALKALDEGLGNHILDINGSISAANDFITSLRKTSSSAGNFRMLIQQTVELIEKQKILSDQHIKRIAGSIETIKVDPLVLPNGASLEGPKGEPVDLKEEPVEEPAGEPFFKPMPGAKRDPAEIQF